MSMKNELNLNVMCVPATCPPCTEMTNMHYTTISTTTKMTTTMMITGSPNVKLKIEKDKAKKLHMRNPLKKLQRKKITKIQKLSNLGGKSVKLRELLKKLSPNPKRKVGGKN